MELANRKAGAAAIGAAILIALSAPSAQAGYVVDLTEQAGNVVATGSGAIDLTGLTFLGSAEFGAEMFPRAGLIITGPVGENPLDAYDGLAGPINFGSGSTASASSGSGDAVGINSFIEILVPAGYVSDSVLSDTATWDDQTFSSLRVIPGAYKWNWGTAPNQNFTLVIATPEPSTWAMMLVGFAGLGAVWRLRSAMQRRAIPA